MQARVVGTWMLIDVRAAMWISGGMGCVCVREKLRAFDSLGMGIFLIWCISVSFDLSRTLDRELWVFLDGGKSVMTRHLGPT